MTRTRVKRRLRAQLAPLVGRLPDGNDLVVRANPAAAGADSHELAEALRFCLQELDLIDLDLIDLDLVDGVRS